MSKVEASSSGVPSTLASINRLPTEILSEIIQLTVPPSVFVSRSLSCTPESAWKSGLRSLKRLVLVSHSWYSAAVEELYRDISLHRLSQVYSLQRTLNAQPSLGELIKVLRITALIHVSEESWDPSPLLTSIRDIIGLCPNLVRLDVDRDISNREHTIFGQIFAPPFTQLKTLNTLNTPFFFLDYAAHFRALSSLSVILLDSPRRETLPDPPRIELPTLRELRMLFPARSGVPKSLDLITDCWTLPALRDVSVTACGCERWDPVEVHPFEYYVRFFKRHGAGLRYLSLVFTFARIDSSYGAWPAPELGGIQRLL
ncbi:hypothetical protein CONPUDRAFT_82854, partial [Coniophora puteana RWD-64-598 SS2]